MRDKVTRFSALQLVGTALIALVFLGYSLFAAFASTNNLAGISIIVLIPASVIAVVLGLIFVVSGRSRR